MAAPIEYVPDVVVVGSGPGGATVARELARGGRRVLLLERGRDHRGHRYYGTHLAALLSTDRGSLLFTEEGVNVIRPLMVGGATGMFCGCASPPPPWLAARYGIDLTREVEEAARELGVEPLPPGLLGTASTRVAEAGRDLGQDWRPLPKFMRPGRAAPFDCGAHCMLGCRCSAKWSAAEYVDDAVEAGARLVTGARVERVLVEGGHAAGVRGRVGRRPFVAHAGTVVLAAGGLGTPAILRRSGFREAGRGLALDTTALVYGFADGPGMAHEPPMTWGFEDEEAGVMLSTLVDPWLSYPVAMARTGWRGPLSWPRWGRALGVMVKLRDDVTGEVRPNGRISKPMTARDRARLARGLEVARRTLVRAGADPDGLLHAPLRGTHPSATVRVGHLLDAGLATEVGGLYVCDASAFPEALGRPTVLTIIGLARRLAARLLGARGAEEARPRAEREGRARGGGA